MAEGVFVVATGIELGEAVVVVMVVVLQRPVWCIVPGTAIDSPCHSQVTLAPTPLRNPPACSAGPPKTCSAGQEGHFIQFRKLFEVYNTFAQTFAFRVF
jgi:hypothetical protein